MKTNNAFDHVIFFITFKQKTPSLVIYLSSLLQQFDIKIIPIYYKEFLKLENRFHSTIITFTPSIEERKKMISFAKSYLYFVLLTGKINFFDLTSFAEIENLVKFKRKDYYHYLTLPIKMNEFCATIVNSCYKDMYSDQNVWPGGKRGGIPKNLLIEN